MDQLEPAGFWIRACARAIDVAVLTAILVMAFDSMNGVTWVGGTLAALAYHSCFEGLAGTSIGKRLLGLQVIAVQGVQITFAQAVNRSVAFLADSLVFGAVGWWFMNQSPEMQRIGDLVARTRVVRRRSLPEELRPAMRRFLVAMAVAIAVAVAIDLAANALG
jgi:uncharacterized RDD family membrane protein YckC